MVSSKNSILDVLSSKIQNSIDKAFWKGKGTHQEFRDQIKLLVENGVISTEEYSYLLKNERRILVKTKLIHLIPELQSQPVMETTLRHLANVLATHMINTENLPKESSEERIIDELNEHFKAIFHPQLSSINDVINYILDIVENSPNYQQEFVKIANLLTDLKDRLLEKGEKRTVIYAIDKYATKLINASTTNDPSKIPSKEDLVAEVKELFKVLQ